MEHNKRALCTLCAKPVNPYTLLEHKDWFPGLRFLRAEEELRIIDRWDMTHSPEKCMCPLGAKTFGEFSAECPHCQELGLYNAKSLGKPGACGHCEKVIICTSVWTGVEKFSPIDIPLPSVPEGKTVWYVVVDPYRIAGPFDYQTFASAIAQQKIRHGDFFWHPKMTHGWERLTSEEIERALFVDFSANQFRAILKAEKEQE